MTSKKKNFLTNLGEKENLAEKKGKKMVEKIDKKKQTNGGEKHKKM